MAADSWTVASGCSDIPLETLITSYVMMCSYIMWVTAESLYLGRWFPLWFASHVIIPEQ